MRHAEVPPSVRVVTVHPPSLGDRSYLAAAAGLPLSDPAPTGAAA